MPTALAAIHRALHPGVTRHVVSSRVLRRMRTINMTLKQTNTASEADVFFNQEDPDEVVILSSSYNLFDWALFSKVEPTQPAVISVGSQEIPSHNPSYQKLFEEIHGILRGFLVDKTEKRAPRDTVRKNLLNVAASRDQLERLVELIPRWRDAKRQCPNRTAVHSAKRCSRLHCSDLALTVFSDRPKYGLDLSKDAATITLHGLQASHPIQDCLTFTSPYNIYRLPPITSDTTSTAFLLMVPSLQSLLANTDPKAKDRLLRLFVIKERKWLAMTLINLSGYIKRHGIEHKWLDEFIEANRGGSKKTL
ncbi:hypothetical protein C8Q74DRAFT_1316206 [Fomes fomentarius]|nr:hypothetical protein C8Q74DRAFT_1316206 [Fomes fomentarius]